VEEEGSTVGEVGREAALSMMMRSESVSEEEGVLLFSGLLVPATTNWPVLCVRIRLT
jgi:hypothetical protein